MCLALHLHARAICLVRVHRPRHHAARRRVQRPPARLLPPALLPRSTLAPHRRRSLPPLPLRLPLLLRLRARRTMAGRRCRTVASVATRLHSRCMHTHIHTHTARDTATLMATRTGMDRRSSEIERGSMRAIVTVAAARRSMAAMRATGGVEPLRESRLQPHRIRRRECNRQPAAPLLRPRRICRHNRPASHRALLPLPHPRAPLPPLLRLPPLLPLPSPLSLLLPLLRRLPAVRVLVCGAPAVRRFDRRSPHRRRPRLPHPRRMPTLSHPSETKLRSHSNKFMTG